MLSREFDVPTDDDVSRLTQTQIEHLVSEYRILSTAVNRLRELAEEAGIQVLVFQPPRPGATTVAEAAVEVSSSPVSPSRTSPLSPSPTRRPVAPEVDPAQSSDYDVDDPLSAMSSP